MSGGLFGLILVGCVTGWISRGQELPVAATGFFGTEVGVDAVEVRGGYTLTEPGRAWFIWGEEALDRQTEAVEVAAGNGNITVVLRGLRPGPVYEYAMVVENSVGRTTGITRTFRKRGQAGYAMNFDFGATIYFWTERDQREFFPTQTITAEFWVKATRHGVVMSEMDLASPSAKNSALVEILEGGEVRVRFVGLGPITIGNAVLGEWCHVAIRFDHTTGILNGWFNGVKASVSSEGTRLEGREWPRAMGYAFAYPTGTDPVQGQAITGELDEVRLWNVARSDEEIARDYNRILPGNQPGLRAYYRFDHERFTDFSGSENWGRKMGMGYLLSGAKVSVVLEPTRVADDLVRMQFLGTEGVEVRLQFTRDFVTWENGPVAMPDALGVARFEVAKEDSAGAIFYRAEPAWPRRPAQ